MRMLFLLLLMSQSACAFSFEFLPYVKAQEKCPEVEEAVKPAAVQWWEHEMTGPLAETPDGLLCRASLKKPKQFLLRLQLCQELARAFWKMKSKLGITYKKGYVYENDEFQFFIMQKGVEK